MASVEGMKKDYPSVRFEALSTPDGFATPKCDRCRVKGLRRIITYPNDAGLNFPNNQEIVDTYIEWSSKGSVTRFMQCMHTPRPECGFDVQYGDGNKFYNLSIDFHNKYLPKLPDLIERVRRFINSSVVEIN